MSTERIRRPAQQPTSSPPVVQSSKKTTRRPQASSRQRGEADAARGGGPVVLVLDEESGKRYPLRSDSQELLQDHIDANIVSVDYWSGPFARQEPLYRTFRVHYKDGRSLLFNLDDIPVRRQLSQGGGGMMARIAVSARSYVRRGGFLFPDLYSEGSTPTLISIATTITFNHRQRERLYQVASVTEVFAKLISVNAGALLAAHSIASTPPGGWRERPRMTPGGPLFEAEEQAARRTKFAGYLEPFAESKKSTGRSTPAAMGELYERLKRYPGGGKDRAELFEALIPNMQRVQSSWGAGPKITSDGSFMYGGRAIPFALVIRPDGSIYRGMYNKPEQFRTERWGETTVFTPIYDKLTKISGPGI